MQFRKIDPWPDEVSVLCELEVEALSVGVEADSVDVVGGSFRVAR
jgi:hypothetical protein